MARFKTKVIPAVICLLLALLILPIGGNIYAQDEASVTIIEPVNSAKLDNSWISIEIAYSVPTTVTQDQYGDVNYDLEIYLRLVALQDQSSGQGAGYDKERIDVVTDITRGNQIWSTVVNIGHELYFPGDEAPYGTYEVEAVIVKGLLGEFVTRATSTFFYSSSSALPPGSPKTLIIKSFTANPLTQKAGEPVTLSWEVEGADLIFINEGVSNLPASGNGTVVPTEASRSAVQYIGEGGVTEVATYTATYTIRASNSYGESEQKTVEIIIEPLTFDEIFLEYAQWGTNPPIQPYVWPDGTSDAQPLVGPSSCGGANNFVETATYVSGIGSYEGIRWDCIAMQYRTLTCLNELKLKGKLIGWDYMPVEGAIWAPTGFYAQHQAVAIWKTAYDWQGTAEILDPHDRQRPHHYPATAGLDSIFAWYPDQDYSEVYPDIPDGFAAKAHEYLLDEFDANNWDRWANGKGAKTPWQGEKTLPAKICYAIGLFCPVNVIITNSAGQRLGKLSDGTFVVEFQPLDAYYWSDINGDKQWYFALADGIYEIGITGIESGNFRLLTYTGGGCINDYGENSIAVGQPAILNLQPGVQGELTIIGSSTVAPEIKPIELFQTSASEGGGVNVALIVGSMAGLLVIIGIIYLTSRKR